MNRKQAAKPIEKVCDKFLAELHRVYEDMTDAEFNLARSRIGGYSTTDTGWHTYALRGFIETTMRDHVSYARQPPPTGDSSDDA